MQQLMTNLFDYLLLWTIKHSMLDRPINVGTNPLFTVIVKQTVRGSREVEKQKTELLNKGIFNELVCVKLCVEWWDHWAHTPQTAAQSEGIGQTSDSVSIWWSILLTLTNFTCN